jgi:hypothetical protein
VVGNVILPDHDLLVNNFFARYDGGMKIIPTTFKQAQEFVREHHRHNRPPVGHKFSIGLVDDNGALFGVATAGRPVARYLDDGFTLEVNRTCTLGDRNANSMLYGAIWRAAKAMGYVKCITYTQHDESGASLRGAGWVKVKDLPPNNGWNAPSRPREDIGSAGVARVRWEINCA